MPVITPEQFKDAFLAIATTHEAKLIECWDNKKPYTGAMFSILQPIASTLGIQVYAGNYYTLDAVFYETKDTTHFSPQTTNVDFISIAFEHENDVRGTATEINKLQLFNAPLKVLVTYCGDDTKGRKNEYLDMYAGMIDRADVFKDISTSRKQLVIFGSCENERACWSFHVYENGHFKRI